jgi:uncharacterized protein
MTTKRSPEDVTIQPRDLRFDVASAHQAHWLDGDPAGTAVMNTLSLTFPDGERLFMDAVRAYKDRLTGKLAQDAKDFIAQEAIHSREHHMLNKMIDRLLPFGRADADAHRHHLPRTLHGHACRYVRRA